MIRLRLRAGTYTRSTKVIIWIIPNTDVAQAWQQRQSPHFSLHWPSSEKQQPQTLLARRDRCAATMDRQLTQQSRSINVRPPSRAFTAGPSTSFVRDESQDSVASAQPQEHSHACISPYDPDFEGSVSLVYGSSVTGSSLSHGRHVPWGEYLPVSRRYP